MRNIIENMLKKVSSTVTSWFTTTLYTVKCILLSEDIHDKNDDIDLAFNIVSNIEKAKDNLDTSWLLASKKEVDAITKQESLNNLCLDYVRLYRTLDLLRSSCVYISSVNSLNKVILSKLDEIENMLFMNNKKLWLSTQEVNCDCAREFSEIKESITFSRYISVA